MDALALLGRLLMSAIFIEGGLHKALDPAATIGMMAHYNMPEPPLAFAVTVAIELVGGLLVLVGYRTRQAAAVLAFWSIATALVAHLHPDDVGQMIHFMKNVCMAGGFLQLVAFGGGRLSLDRR
jgi:putative oxidoreductase